MKTNISPDTDGFTIGERLDIEIAKGANFIVLALGETGDEAQSKRVLHAQRGGAGSIANHLNLMKEHEGGDADELLAMLRDIIMHYDMMNKTTDPSELKDKELSYMDKMFKAYNASSEAAGFFFLTLPDHHGLQVQVGSKGELKELVKRFVAFAKRDPGRAIKSLIKFDQAVTECREETFNQLPMEDFGALLMSLVKQVKDDRQQ